MVMELIVRDQGVGMTFEVQQRLFEAFMQGDSSTNRRFGGTGLGMAISHRIIQAMHGQITVESQPGHGSTCTVTVSLP
jgi:protein-histidine pros-kinase